MTGDGADARPQTVKAVVLIAVVILAGVLVLHHSSNSTTRASATSAPAHHGAATPPTSAAPTTTTIVATAATKVQVLNGANPASPLASQWSTKLKTTYGYNTLPGDNATAKVTVSAIYVLTPGFIPAAQHLATVVGIPATAVNTTIPPPATAPIPPRDKTSANLVLIIGPDLAATA